MENTIKSTVTYLVPSKTGKPYRATVISEPATLNDARATRPRWFLEVGPENIIGARLVKVAIDLGELSDPTPEAWHFTEYLVVETAAGHGLVLYDREGSELCAFIPKEKKSAALVWGIYVFKKYRQWRGRPMAYLIAHRRGLKTTCGAELYERLAGKPWPPVRAAG